MKRCVLCKKEFPTNISLCPDDGQPLVNADAIKVDPLIGQTIMDKYHIVKLLGRGGMGGVYEGEHRLLGRRVAIKVMNADIVSDDTAVARFFREAKTSAKLEHPNAVTIHDFGSLNDGGAFIVMEFIEGKSLRQLLSRNGAIPVEQALEWIQAICSAVEAAHRRGIIHRDIKPENIMLKEGHEGITVKVVDFGLAKLNSGEGGNSVKLSKTGDIMGTPQYMAPELFDGESADARADVYALGIMFYEMITGSTPFTGTMQHVISGHLLKDPKPVAQLNPALNSNFDQVIGLALKKNRDERIGSPIEFANSLKSLRLTNKPINVSIATSSASENSVEKKSVSNIDVAPISTALNTPTLKHSGKLNSVIEQPVMAQETGLINQKYLSGESLNSNLNLNTGVVKANTANLTGGTQQLQPDENIEQQNLISSTVKMTMSLDPSAASFNSKPTSALNAKVAETNSGKKQWLVGAAIASLLLIGSTSFYVFSNTQDGSATTESTTPSISQPAPTTTPNTTPNTTPITTTHEPLPLDKSASKSNRDRKSNNRTTQNSSYPSTEPVRQERAPRQERAERENRDDNGRNVIQEGLDKGKAIKGMFGSLLGGDKKKKDRRRRED